MNYYKLISITDYLNQHHKISPLMHFVVAPRDKDARLRHMIEMCINVKFLNYQPKYPHEQLVIVNVTKYLPFGGGGSENMFRYDNQSKLENMSPEEYMRTSPELKNSLVEYLNYVK